MKLPAEIPPDAITAIIDRREQMPLTLPGIKSQPGTLTTGDYSAVGLESVIAIERKSLADCVACCGRDRERFDREVQRLIAFPVRALVLEADWLDVEQANWRGSLTSKQVGSSLIGWQCRGLPIITAGNHERAGVLVASMIRRTAIHRWRQLRAFAAGIEKTPAPSQSVD